MAALWPYDLSFNFRLEEINHSITLLDGSLKDMLEIRKNIPAPRGMWPASPAHWLLVNGSLYFDPDTPLPMQFTLSYYVSIMNNCTHDTKPGDWARLDNYTIGYTRVERRIEIGVAADGEVPDIGKALAPLACNATGDAARNPAIAITVEGERSYEEWWNSPTREDIDGNILVGDYSSSPCPIVAHPPPAPELCPFQTDKAVAIASSVQTEMLATASCTTGSWPDPTGLVDFCRHKKSIATSVRQPSMGLGAWLVAGISGLSLVFL